jgi:hypothetical protein
MDGKTFLVVFHGEWQGNKVIDISDDPCFNSPPSWGICRPPTRKAIRKGDTIIFIANIGKDYFLKGWFEVKDKLDYLSAMIRFPSRLNVIISSTFKARSDDWRYKDLKKAFKKKYNSTIPSFLLYLKVQEGTFYQNPKDDHELDNWKCRRIFLCKNKDFQKCTIANRCLKDNVSIMDAKYKNYIVANKGKWEDVDRLKITFDEICKATGFNKSIITPKHQHNVLRFDDFKDRLLDYISEKSKS